MTAESLKAYSRRMHRWNRIQKYYMERGMPFLDGLIRIIPMLCLLAVVAHMWIFAKTGFTLPMADTGMWTLNLARFGLILTIILYLGSTFLHWNIRRWMEQKEQESNEMLLLLAEIDRLHQDQE